MERKKKILVGGIYHESHSFSNVPTDLESFKKVLFLPGRDSIEQLRGSMSEMNGFILGSEKFDLELIPTLWAWTVSSGPVMKNALDHMLAVVRESIENSEELDGVLFALHGAMVAENSLDGDGYILSKLREFVGEGIPIAVTIDLHANISPLMVEKADIIVGYDTYPHIDQIERGQEAAELLVRTINGEIDPVMAIVKPPMVIVPNMQLTDAEPMKGMIELAHQIEKDPAVLSVTASCGFSYADVPEIGPTGLVLTNGKAELAERYAKQVSDRFWVSRESFIPKMLSVAEAVEASIRSRVHPVILADTGDNIGAGTPGDSTFILQELLIQKAEGAVVIIADAESAKTAIEAADSGESVKLRIGGKTDEYHGEPVELVCHVESVTDGIFRNVGPMRDGIIENMGATAVVSSGGIKIVLTEIKMPPWNLEQLRSVGIDPTKEKIIALKSAVAFRAAYEPIAGSIIEVNSPGLSAADLSQFQFNNIEHPIFPLDEMDIDADQT